jgi:predicted Ser/Thr protein kinase/WD40 repeat protein
VSLYAGLQLGSFEIVRLLGAGGMGEIYLAHDRDLNRSVAVKVLRVELTTEPNRLARFEQEARTASALSHPNICHIYQVGDTPDGQRYIAMEYVDGETLHDRLLATRLTLREALDIAIQIAFALTAAHASGIVHRDIKPENVMIRRDRLIKVLDFGVAKLVPSAMVFASHGPTQTVGATEPGSLVGTIGYMSPEQARGQEVDARTDIWALGVVLYEMIASRAPFTGTSRSDVLVEILDREAAPLARFNREVPAELQRIVGKALRKDPEQRYQVMKDLLLDLEALRDDPAAVAAPAAADARRHRFVTPARLAAAFMIAGLSVLTGWWIAPRPAATGAVYSLDLMLDGLEVSGDMAPTLSPDGRWLVYRASGQLWRRALNEFTSKPLPDSSGAVYPFWSPDSRQIAFVRDRKLWRLPIDAANAMLVGDAPVGLSGSGAGVWTVSGDLVLAGSDTVGLFSTPVHDGNPREILPLDKNNETDFHQVAALPEGRGLLVAVHRSQGSDTIDALVNGRRQTVLQLPGEIIQAPIYSPAGYLLFERETTSRGIWAVRFSIDRLATGGAPFLLVAGGSSPTLGSDGTLAFVRGGALPSQLVWIDRKGSIEPIGELNGQLGQGSGPVMALSPDGRRLALSIDHPGGTELWSYDLSRGSMTRLSAGATRVTSPIWTPDGRQIFFGAFGRGRLWDVYSIPSSETREPARVLPESAVYRWPCTISPDGRWMIYAAQRTDRATDLWLAPQNGPVAAQPLMKTPFREDYAKFSPDGRSILYMSDESGRAEVYVRAFPIGPERVQVSTNGGSMPIWAPDGREIFYRTPTALMAVTMTRTAAGLAASAPQQLFTVDPDSQLFEPFAVASNGRFLFARATGRPHVSVIVNWSRAVTQLEEGAGR